LQPGIRATQALAVFWLDDCQLGDEGISRIVDALHVRTTSMGISLASNNITSTGGLPHVT
jgi:hypothetical protein